MPAETSDHFSTSRVSVLAPLFRNLVRSLHAGSDSETVLITRAAEALKQLTEAATVVIYRNAGANRAPQFAALASATLQPGDLRSAEELLSGAVGEALRLGTIRITAHVAAERGYAPVIRGAGSEVVLPILHRREVLGVAVLASPAEDAFGRERLEFASLLADQIAIAWQQVSHRLPAILRETDWAALAESSRDGLILCDEQLRVRRANRAFLRTAKRAFAELRGLSVRDVFQRLSLFGSHEDFWQDLQRTGHETRSFRSISGKRQFRIEAWRLSHGAATGFSVQLRETTATEHFQRQLRQAESVRFGTATLQKHAQRLGQSLTPLLNFVRNNVTRVDVVRSSEEGEILAQSCQDAEGALDALRAEAGITGAPTTERFTLVDAVQAAFATWLAEHKHAQVNARIVLPKASPKLPAPDGAVRELIVLLLNRAQRGVVAEPGSITPELLLTLEVRDSRPVLRVSHNGFGRRSGALLGDALDPVALEWAMARQLARAKGIDLREVSQETMGEVIEARWLAPAVVASVAPASRRDFAGARVLVVETDALLRDLLLTVLSDKGAVVTAVESVDEAIAEMEEQPFNIVLSEFNASSSSGMDVERELRQRRPALVERTTFLTGWEQVTGPLPAIDQPDFSGSPSGAAGLRREGLKPAA
jgi:PAS domain S-box-containing protein